MSRKIKIVHVGSTPKRSPGASRHLTGQAGLPLYQRRDGTLTLRAIETNGLTSRLGFEAEAGQAHDAGLMHLGPHIVRAEPSAGLRHIGYVLKDHDIIRVFGAAEYLTVCDACRTAARFVFSVALMPSRIVLDFVVNGQVFGRMPCHRHYSKIISNINSNDYHSNYKRSY